MSKYHVTVKLPRFKLEQSLQLKDTLSNLGCPTMFTPEANFSNVVEDGDLYVNKLVHKAYVDVNEKGTVAAAVTTTVFSYSLVLTPPKVEFHANHPFVMMILSRAGDVLFHGRLSKP
ncbi:unnamed protein product [Macrosiphum euphorbiae]|uniref:Serpin domain-containing protein n=1 Tax=Macrosiphum euphorbiae TaxID=13131 RepID=A0AAV0XJY4_9HEMI|nr:unnamed protein product [Macrosiphum euphorbiae]